MAAVAHPPGHGKRRLRARALLAVLATAWLLALGLLYAAGYRPLVVASGSMAPSAATGDLIITHAVAPGAVAVGDVVSFHDRSRDGSLVTHRVTAMHREGGRTAFVTRGDVNGGVERWSSAADARIGRLALRIPLAGYAVTWLTQLPIILALLAIVLLAFTRGASAARGTVRATRRVARSTLAALASAATIISIPLMLATTEGAFSAVTSNAANSFQAAAQWCPSASATANADTAIAENSPTSNFANDASLLVVSRPAENYRTLVRFPLAATPAGCSVTTATMTLARGQIAGDGRTVQARRAQSAWVENTVTWNTKPVGSGTDVAAITTSGTTSSFDVTQQVKTMLGGTNTGFIIQDSVEGYAGSFGIGAWQLYDSREATTAPTLTITYSPI
jgi:signal peptidase I